MSPRHAAIAMLALGGLLAGTAPASAQVGVGGRLAWVANDADVDTDSSVRFVGGQIRLLSQRTGLEISMDRRSESFEFLNQKITLTPIQASLIMRLAKGRVSPFLLGGPGWYRRTIAPLEGPDGSVTTTEFGWHAGGGLEILPNKHLGIHGDYRYTFVDFSGDDDDDEGFVGRLLPGHRGSMWTFGATVYF